LVEWGGSRGAWGIRIVRTRKRKEDERSTWNGTRKVRELGISEMSGRKDELKHLNNTDVKGGLMRDEGKMEKIREDGPNMKLEEIPDWSLV